jgi:Na+/proline symporter
LRAQAPKAHTIVEIINIRFGTAGHCVYLFYSISTNILVTAMLLLGGAGAVTALTGMHVVAASFLLPVGVFIYTVMGGLKSTFLSDWGA